MSILYTILLDICKYCTYYTYFTRYNTLYIFANIVQYLLVLYNICQYCCYVPVLFIHASFVQYWPILYNICQYCSLLPERNAGCCCYFSACCFNAARTTDRLTTLCFCNHLFIEHPRPLQGRQHPRGGALHSPQQGGQQMSINPVRSSRDRRAVYHLLTLYHPVAADYCHASCSAGTWHTKTPAPPRNFNAPSLPFQGDQAVNAHATRAPAQQPLVVHVFLAHAMRKSFQELFWKCKSI